MNRLKKEKPGNWSSSRERRQLKPQERPLKPRKKIGSKYLSSHPLPLKLNLWFALTLLAKTEALLMMREDLCSRQSSASSNSGKTVRHVLLTATVSARFKWLNAIQWMASRHFKELVMKLKRESMNTLMRIRRNIWMRNKRNLTLLSNDFTCKPNCSKSRKNGKHISKALPPSELSRCQELSRLWCTYLVYLARPSASPIAMLSFGKLQSLSFKMKLPNWWKTTRFSVQSRQ